MIKPQNIRIEDFSYNLPDEKIARFPMAERDSSKLCIAGKDEIKQDVFKNISAYLPENSLLVVNNTKVVQARLKFQKETGAQIEVFCLEPISPYNDVQLAFQAKETSDWKCLVGGAKKWKSGKLMKYLPEIDTEVSVEKFEILEDAYRIRFEWSNPKYVFADIINAFGLMPLPPYLKRDAEESDNQRYQTIYAEHQGSVAAPTAGLHFTDKVFQDLKSKNIEILNISLHVGAGTFKPVSAETMQNHVMHAEQVVVSKDFIEKLIENSDKALISVGTTSSRSLESLFWYGQLLEKDSTADFFIPQWLPYELTENELVSKKKSLENILNKMNSEQLDELHGSTQIIIAPGYTFRIVDFLITNFHQPHSTLLLLVAAFYGDKWKDVYDFALKNDFRFLSYGDSCLFMNKGLNHQ